jgi:hypothetical protein
MTTTGTATPPTIRATVLAPTREELLSAFRKRHPRISDDRLGKLLDRRLACGAIDVIRDPAGEIDIRLTGAMRRN